MWKDERLIQREMETEVERRGDIEDRKQRSHTLMSYSEDVLWPQLVKALD
jgi:hypothetical protein